MANLKLDKELSAVESLIGNSPTVGLNRGVRNPIAVTGVTLNTVMRLIFGDHFVGGRAQLRPAVRQRLAQPWQSFRGGALPRRG